MKILIVEDNKTYLNSLTESLASVDGLTLKTAESRDSADEALDKDIFDLVICDLRIPTVDNAVDSDVSHGQVVYTRINRDFPGTIVIILSGWAKKEELEKIIPEARKEDVFGTGEIQMLAYVNKDDDKDLINTVESLSKEFASLNDIEINQSLGCDLTDIEKRVVQLFASKIDGKIVEVTSLGGGLSGSKVLKIMVTDKTRANLAPVVGKLSLLKWVNDAKTRYNRHMAGALPMGSFAPLNQEIKAGAGNFGGLFYALANGYDETLFDVLLTGDARAVDAVCHLQKLCAPWCAATVFKPEESIGDIRRRLVADNRMNEFKHLLDGIDWQTFENRKVSINKCRQHMDFHGLNSLFTKDLTPVLIDYDNVGFASRSLDPITLELSLVFHPAAAAIRGDWPSVTEASEWPNLEPYLNNCPVPDFVAACRDWARVETTKREVLANAYAVLVGLLRHKTTDKEKAVAMISSIVEAYD